MNNQEKTFINGLIKATEEKLNSKINIRNGNDEYFFVEDESGEVIQHIGKKYIECALIEERLEDAIDGTVELIRVGLLGNTKKTKEKLQSIFPFLINENEFTEAKKIFKKHGDKIMYRETKFKDIYVLLVEDSEDSIAFLPKSILEILNVSEDELFSIAMENLKNKKCYPKILFGDEMNLTSFSTGDGFDATRILTLPFNTIEEGMEGDVLVVIPHRDFLAVFDSADFEDTAPLFLSNFEKYQENRRNGVTPDIFRFKNGEFVEQIKGPFIFPLS